MLFLGPLELTAKSLQELSLRLEEDIGPAWIILFTKQGSSNQIRNYSINIVVF